MQLLYRQLLPSGAYTFPHYIKTSKTSCAGGRHNMLPPPASWHLTFWLWKWCPSRVKRATCVLILVFLSLSVLDLGPMYAADRRQTDRYQTSDAHHRLTDSALWRWSIIMFCSTLVVRTSRVVLRTWPSGPENVRFSGIVILKTFLVAWNGFHCMLKVFNF